MNQETQIKKIKTVEVIVESAGEMIDFTDFVREVLEFEMIKRGVFACFINLERPQGKLEGSENNKQRGSDKIK